jgi:hypothetical protein
MKNIVRNLVFMCFWVVFLADVIEFFAGYYEQNPLECTVAQDHHILKETWYSVGCRMGGK